MDLQLKYVKNEDGVRRLTIPEDRRLGAIAFVRDGAGKAPGEIESIVQEGHDTLFRILDDVSETQAAHKPSADDWCVLELMAHVVTTKRIVAVLCEHLAAGRLPPGFGPQFEEERAQDGVTIARFETLAEARAEALTAHESLLACIRNFDDGTNDDLRFKHFVFGAFNAREWSVFQRIHDENHTPQLRDIKASAGYPAA